MTFSPLTDSADGVMIAVHLQPKASRNHIAGIHGDALKVQITAPPVDGKANKALREFLAKILGVPKSDVELVSGQTSREKRVLVKGISMHECRARLEGLMTE